MGTSLGRGRKIIMDDSNGRKLIDFKNIIEGGSEWTKETSLVGGRRMGLRNIFGGGENGFRR